MWLCLVSGTLHEMEIRKCVVLAGVVVERREVVSAKPSSLRPPLAPAKMHGTKDP